MRRRFWWVACIIVLLVPVSLTAQAAAGDSIVYVLAPTSRFEVRTGSAGLLGFAGHDHLIRARVFAGQIVYWPDDPSASRVSIALRADRLEVLTPPDTAEIRKVTASMDSEVLDVARFPEIRFVSTAVAPRPHGLEIRGDLTIRGVTQAVIVDVQTTVTRDTLTARGAFTVKQTDYGIRPYRGGPAGTVKVANRIEFRIDAIAVRGPA
jgi:polyisoprenoid-binding protein YceI